MKTECEGCGIKTEFLEDCPECGGIFCSACFDGEMELCNDCLERKEEIGDRIMEAQQVQTDKPWVDLAQDCPDYDSPYYDAPEKKCALCNHFSIAEENKTCSIEEHERRRKIRAVPLFVGQITLSIYTQSTEKVCAVNSA